MPRSEHPLIEPPDAYSHPGFVGVCSWGNCDHVSDYMRWEPKARRYVTVCEGHKRGKKHKDAECQRKPLIQTRVQIPVLMGDRR